MRICIWCQKNESVEYFIKNAHTFPQSMGGNNIVENVCDSCNHYFGATKSTKPAVEVVLKELLNISRYLLLHSINKPPKKGRFKSFYFNVDFKNLKVKLKNQYKLRKGFQQMLGRQFRRALYMVYLEERERLIGDVSKARFNFIREFSRYDLGNYPIYIQIPKFPAVFSSDTNLENPELYFTEHSETIDRNFKVYQLYLFGHNFLIPTSKFFKQWYLKSFSDYLVRTDNPVGTRLKEVLYAEDIDYTFRFLHER